MGQKGIGVSNLPNVKYRSFCKAGIDFNIMTIGSNGLGKSSFINQMLGVPVLSFDPFLDVNERNDQDDRYFHKNSILNVQVSKFFVMENEFQTRITVTEVDGVGDNVCNDGCWEPVTELICDNFNDFLHQERGNVRSLIKDKRIHVCLYLLEPNPTHLKISDIRTMKEISRICNLIPVVGKSDLLNEQERQECNNRILDALSQENIDVFHLEVHERERIERIRGPFFIISKNISSHEKSKSEREYPWGPMSLDRVKHNDFYLLVDALITKNLVNLIEATESFYDDYKTREIGQSIMDGSGNLGQEDKKLAKEIQKKIKEDERIVVELRQRLLEKKKCYEDKLLEMANKIGNEK